MLVHHDYRHRGVAGNFLADRAEDSADRDAGSVAAYDGRRSINASRSTCRMAVCDCALKADAV